MGWGGGCRPRRGCLTMKTLDPKLFLHLAYPCVFLLMKKVNQMARVPTEFGPPPVPPFLSVLKIAITFLCT